jgi:uncharacterized membrane protein YkoI
MKAVLKNAVLVMVLFSVSAFVMSGENERKQENVLQQLAKVTFAQAKATALAKAPGKIVEAGLEVENGLLVYSFDIRADREEITEVQINAKDGSVVLAKRESMQDEAAEAAEDLKKVEASGSEEADEGLAKGSEHGATRVMQRKKDAEEPIVGTIHVKKHFHLKKLAKIGADDARQSALKMVEGKVKEVELENENGFLVYNVSILFNRQEWEVLVDAGNGLVLTVDLDD